MTDHCERCPFRGCEGCLYQGYPQAPVDENGCGTSKSGTIDNMNTTLKGGADDAP